MFRYVDSRRGCYPVTLGQRGCFKNINLSPGGARSMIQGRRLGRPLLGKWHLCSSVVSVIGLRALAADSSPREAPPACQLHSIRKPRLLLFTVQAPRPSSALPSRLPPTTPQHLHSDHHCPLFASPTEAVNQERIVHFLLIFAIDFLSFFFFLISGDVLITHSLPPPFSLYEYWYQQRMLGASFCLVLCFHLYISLCLDSSPPSLSPSKQTLTPPLLWQTSSLPPLIILWACPWGWCRVVMVVRAGCGGGGDVRVQKQHSSPCLRTTTQAQLELSRKKLLKVMIVHWYL